MKKLFGKRFHRIPVVLVSVILAVALMAGGALAVNDSHPFFTSTLQAQVNEALAVGAFDTWDNLKPYGSDSSAVWEWEQDSWHTGELGDVSITLSGPPELPVLTITHAAETPRTGEGFVAGEWIVIPLNIRNASSGALNLSAFVTSNGLDLDCCWLTNEGTATEQHPDGDLNYNFKASEGDNWVSLNGWTEIIDGFGGHSGSARIGAKVLFVRISAPGNIVPTVEGSPYILSVELSRS